MPQPATAAPRTSTSRAALPTRESLTIEFKRDLPPPKGPLGEGEIVLAALCLANHDGGTLYVGLEDDGRVSGTARWQNADELQSCIAAKTMPRLSADVTILDVDGLAVARIVVPKASFPTMYNGMYQRRQIKKDGTPECVGMQAQEIASRMGGPQPADPSAAPVPGATMEDVDPIQRRRLARAIEERLNAEKVLLGLDEDALDDALGLSVEAGGTRVPTLAGLLLLGHEAALRRLVPGHEVAMQVFAGTELRVNRHSRAPLLEVLDDVERQFATVPAEGELTLGLRRLPIPSVDADAFREAVLNALVHRDYGLIGTVSIQLHGGELAVSSPGGLIAGIKAECLLNTPPTPRNRTLADAFKRVGYVERSGRGVDRIFEGQVRYGRPLPDYSRTTGQQVVVELPRDPADREFLTALLTAESGDDAGSPNGTHQRLEVHQVIVLAALRRSPGGRLTLQELADEMQCADRKARTHVKALEDRGFIAAQGQTKARFYKLGPAFLHLMPATTNGIPEVALPSPEEQERRVVEEAARHGRVNRAQVIQLLPLTEEQATKLLVRMAERGLLERRGEKRGTHYVVPRAADLHGASTYSGSDLHEA